MGYLHIYGHRDNYIQKDWFYLQLADRETAFSIGHWTQMFTGGGGGYWSDTRRLHLIDIELWIIVDYVVGGWGRFPHNDC